MTFIDWPVVNLYRVPQAIREILLTNYLYQEKNKNRFYATGAEIEDLAANGSDIAKFWIGGKLPNLNQRILMR